MGDTSTYSRQEGSTTSAPSSEIRLNGKLDEERGDKKKEIVLFAPTDRRKVKDTEPESNAAWGLFLEMPQREGIQTIIVIFCIVTLQLYE